MYSVSLKDQRTVSPIIRRLFGLLRDDSLRARAFRGAALTFLGFGSQQFLRLLSNLLLTRLLFPEAFGLMALVTVVLTGLQMFSDTGLHVSIVQSKRGEDPVFLNTAWTLQIIRGVFLGLIAAALAVPLAAFYDQPQLIALLPVAGLTTVIMGLQSTKEFVANRRLTLGRLTVIELVSQGAGIVLMVILAYLYRSVWALLIGALFAAALRSVLSHVALPGQANRLAWEREAFYELFHFGKYIFVSSIAGFLINNADRAVLGKFVSIGMLGIYNIGFFMASVPFMLSLRFTNRVLLPIYSQSPPKEGAANRRNVRQTRFLLTGGLVLLGFLLSLTGDWLIGVLYEDAYDLARPVMVLMSVSLMPPMVTHAYGALLLGAGNSRDFTILLLILSTVQMALLIFTIKAFGLLGAIFTPGLSTLLVYPATDYFARREGGWDPLLDFAFALVIGLGAAVVLYFNGGAIPALLASIPQ